MSEAENLQTVFTADLSDLNKGLDKATAGVAKFGKDAEKGASAAANGIKAGAGLAAGGISALASAMAGFVSIGFASKLTGDAVALGKLAQTAGLTAVEFQRFTQGAQISGFLGDSGAALAEFAKGAGLARARMGDLYETIKIIAPEVATQLAGTKTTAQALDVYAEAIRRVNGEEAKATLARKAFGEEGAQLVPILRNGAAGLAAMGAKADEFTTKVDEGAIRSAKAFKVEIGLLATEAENQLTNRLAGAADAAAGAMKRMREAIKSSGKDTDALNALKLTGQAEDVDALTATIGRLQIVLANMKATGTATSWFGSLEDDTKAAEGELASLNAQLEKVLKKRDAANGNLPAWSTTVTPGTEAPKAKDGFDLRAKPDYRGADAIAQAQQALAAARGEMFRSIDLETQTQIEAARRVNEELILSETQFQTIKSDLTAAGAAKRKQLEEDQVVSLRGLQSQAIQAAIGDEAQFGTALTSRTKAAELEYQNDLVNWRRLYEQKLITAEQFEAARANVAAISNAKIRDATRQQTADIESAMSSALGNGLTNALNGSKDAGKTFFLEMTNGLARAITQMLILKPLMDGLFSGNPGSFGSIISGALGSIGGVPAVARAEGGGVTAGVPTFINERAGRQGEVFVPQSSGRMVPGERFDGAGGGGGTTNVFHIDARGADAGAVQRIERSIIALEANRTNPVEASRAHAQRYPLRR